MSGWRGCPPRTGSSQLQFDVGRRRGDERRDTVRHGADGGLHGNAERAARRIAALDARAGRREGAPHRVVVGLAGHREPGEGQPRDQIEVALEQR